jgi:hypothetical protein
MHRFGLSVCYAAALLLILDAAEPPYQWPDPRKNGIVLVNANQDIVTYLSNHPSWFQSGETVLDISVPNRPDRDASEQERIQVVNALHDKGLTAGTYTSGTTVEPLAAIKLWPYDKVPIEWMPPDFGQAGSWPNESARRIIDLTDVRTRHALQDGMRRIWQGSSAPIRFVDNAASHSSTGGTQPWAAYCANIAEIRQVGESLGCRLVFNVSVHLAFLSDAEATQLVRAVGKDNGILLEQPWGDATRKSPELTRKAQARYRQLLDAGMVIVVLPVDLPVDILMSWLKTWRHAGDRLYLGWPFFKEPWLAGR